MHESDRERITPSDDLFPSIQLSKSDHNIVNLQKLCVEITEFLRSVYASTKSDEERSVYRAMVDKLK